VNGGLTALPNINLVANVGFDCDATHTTRQIYNTSISAGIDPHSHPSFVLRDCEADRYTYYHHFGGKYHRFPYSLARFIKSRIYKILRLFNAGKSF
jgi:hypothetical protein